VTRLHTRELNKTSRDVEAVLMGITTREMVGEGGYGREQQLFIDLLECFHVSLI
jgi:hypothetical protein